MCCRHYMLWLHSICRQSDSYGCCPMEVAVCCNDSSGHCCPQGYPICDNNHHVCKDHLTNSVPKTPRVEARKLAMTPDLYLQYFTGFMAGIEIEIGTDDLSACAKETFDAAESLVQFFRYVTQLRYSDFNRDIALEELSEFLHSYAFGKINCVNVLKESTDLFDKLLAKFENPGKLVQTMIDNLWFRGNYIYRELKRAEHAGPFETGLHYGSAATLLIQ
mmetsp:Transcript_1745/g.3709  ORF Transcript_1745/g.3709 Transcript_1745/m.3709 type:complete len:219 (+) Transcript_1745:128-784(+)